MRIELESPVECADGLYGRVRDVVVDPHRRLITHLVIEPRHHAELARLVPFDDIDIPADGSAVRLGCASEAVHRYPNVDETAYVQLGAWPGPGDGFDAGVTSFVSPPVEGLADHALIAYDRIPIGEVELRRRSDVTANDGTVIGHLDAVELDRDARIHAIVVDHGHLWTRRRVGIPIEHVREVRTDAVVLRLTTDEVSDLPPIDER